MADRVWFAESLRATFFPAVAPGLSPREWWTLVAGAPNADLVVNEGPAGHANATATIENGNAILQLACTPDRLDWGYAIGMGPDETGALVPAREISAVEATGEFLNRLESWMPHAPICRRIAFGAVYRAVAASKEEGYEILREQLQTVDIDPIGSSDFFYRINRPRQSKTAPFPLKVNRVAQWSVMSFHGQPANQNLTLTYVPQSMKSRHFCRVEIDCNTAADNADLIEKPFIGKTLRELSDLGLEIAQFGDVR